MSFPSENFDATTDISLDNNHPENEGVFDSNRLNFEEVRMNSFVTWPVHFPVDPARLAKAGFYYTGTEDEVVCFSCQGHLKNWNYGDIVLKKHSDLYPDCDFIRNVSNNVPLLKTSVKPKTEPCSIKNSSEIAQLNFDVDYEKMKFQVERISTFGGKWPLSNVNVRDLAYAGYFYTGLDDKIQCAFCKVVVDNLKSNSALCGVYLKHFPWCDLSDKLKAKNEVPWYQTPSQDVCGNMTETESSPNNVLITNKLIYNPKEINLEDFGVYIHNNPFYRGYASLNTRLKTFECWSSNVPVSKEDLAEAGFFYLGTEDFTVCFHCNGRLKKWEAGDEPWVEHARWFPGCNFLRLNKGSDFIIACLLRSASTFVNENIDVSSQSDTSESLLKKLDEAMKSNLVRNLAESGMFPLYILRAASLLQIKLTGSSFSNSDDLILAASYLKKKMEQHFHKESVKAKNLIQISDLNISLNSFQNYPVSSEAEEPSKMLQTPSHSRDISHESHVNKGESFVNSCTTSSEKANSMQLNEKDHYLCKICMDKELGVVFLPCGHLTACTICAPALQLCPLCRKPIQATVKCFLH